MNQTGRYARVGSPVQEGIATVTRALDPVTGLPVRVYRFDADPVPGAATLRHPSVVQVLAAGRDDDGGFLVADVIDGAAGLDTRPGGLDIATAAAALRALAAVHEHGVVHGDATARRVLRRGADVWLEGVGVPWRAAAKDDDVRQLVQALLAVPGHALSSAAVEHLRAAVAVEHVDAGTLADDLEHLEPSARGATTRVPLPAATGAATMRSDPDLGEPDPDDETVAHDDATTEAALDETPGDDEASADETEDEPADDEAADDEPADDEAVEDEAVEDETVADEARADEADDEAARDEAAADTQTDGVDTAPEPTDGSPPTVVRRRVATSDMAPEPVPLPGPIVSRRIAGDPPPQASPAPAPQLRPTPPTPPAKTGSFSKTPPPDVRYRVGETPLDERPAGGGRTAGPTGAQRQRRRTWMLAALLIGALVLAVVTAVARRPVPPPAPASGTVTSIVVDVRLEPASLPPASLVVVASPSGSRLRAGSALGTVPRRVVFDAEGTWQVEARFQDRRSETVTFRLPDEREIVLRFPALR